MTTAIQDPSRIEYWLEAERQRARANAGLSEPDLRLVCFNAMGIGVMLADRRHNWVLHPITADLIRDSRAVRNAVAQVYIARIRRINWTAVEQLAALSVALDRLGHLLLRANYNLTENQAWGLAPLRVSEQDHVRKQVWELILRTVNQIRRDGGLFCDGREFDLFDPDGSRPVRRDLEWPPRFEDDVPASPGT